MKNNPLPDLRVDIERIKSQKNEDGSKTDSATLAKSVPPEFPMIDLTKPPPGYQPPVQTLHDQEYDEKVRRTLQDTVHGSGSSSSYKRISGHSGHRSRHNYYGSPDRPDKKRSWSRDRDRDRDRRQKRSRSRDRDCDRDRDRRQRRSRSRDRDCDRDRDRRQRRSRSRDCETDRMKVSMVRSRSRERKERKRDKDSRNRDTQSQDSINVGGSRVSESLLICYNIDCFKKTFLLGAA